MPRSSHVNGGTKHCVPARCRGAERGTGLLSSVAGITVFLGFLFFAVQLLFNLYATSVVTANAYDAARQVASSEVDHTSAAAVSDARVTAETEARARMGRYGSRVDAFDWRLSTPDVVRLRIRAHNPDLLRLGGLLGFDDIDRTVVVRTEQFRR